MRKLELFKPQVVSCPPRIREVGERYAEILGGTPHTMCFITPIYHHAIDFGSGSVEVIEDRDVLIEGEIIVERENLDRVVRMLRNIRTRSPYGELTERACAVAEVHRHVEYGEEFFHVHFVCSPISLAHRTENIERILKTIKRIVDRYGIVEPI